MESIILTGKVTGIEQSIIRGARSAERALNLRPKIDASGLNRLSGPLGRITGQANEFNKSMEASNARVLAFGASAGAIFAVQRGLRAVITDAIEVEKVIADINSVLNQTNKNLAKFTDEIFQAAKNAGTGFQVAAEAALELSRQGLSAEATTKRLNAALILARLGGLEAKDAVEGLTAAINSFSKEALDDVVVVNKLANVAAKFAVSERDLTEAIKRSASAASDAGVSFDELVALVTAAQQTTARGGAVIGNSLKTIFTRLQRSSTLEQLEKIGVAVRQVNGELLGAPQILKNLSLVYDGLGQEQKAFVSELVGGVFQINQLKAQLNDLSKEYGFYARALVVANDATDEAIRRNEELNKTTAASLNAIKVGITQLSAELGSNIFGPVIKELETWANFFLKIFSSQEGEKAGTSIGEGLLKGIGGALSGPGLALASAGLIALFLRLGSFAVQAGKSILDNVRGVERQRQVQAEVQKLLELSGKSYADIIKGATSLEQVERRILAIVREQVALRASAGALTSNLSPGFASGGGLSRVGIGQSKIGEAGMSFSGGKFNIKGEAPRFADPIAQAVNREKMAGVPASSIYVDRDPRVKSPRNPMGLLVANRRDEPLGGFQGVNRAIALGMDPKKGTGNGFVPNFAEFDNVSRRTPTGKVKDILGNVSILSGEQTLFADEAKKLRSLSSKVRMAVSPQDFSNAVRELNEYTKTLNLTNSGLAKVNTVIQNAGAKLGKVMAERAEEEKRLASIFRSGGNKLSTEEAEARMTAIRNREQARYATGIPYSPSIPVGLRGGGSIEMNSLRGQIARASQGRNISELLSGAQESISSGTRFSQLDKRQRGAIDAAAFRSAIQSDEFRGFTSNQIKADPVARELLRKRIGEFRSQFIQASSAVNFDQALSGTFATRERGIAGFFGSAKGDEKALRNTLGVPAGQKLTPQQQIALETRQQQTRQLRSGRLTGGAIAASFGASALAGSGVLGSGVVAGGVQGAASGAALGSLAGPMGIAVMGTLGLAVGTLGAAAKKSEKEFRAAADAYQQLSASLESNVTNAQQYATVQAQLSDLIASGNAKTSDITNLNTQLTTLFNNIGDNETRRKFLDAAGNVDALNKAVSELANKNALKLAEESVGVAITAANAGRVNKTLGFGGTARTEDLAKIGDSLAISSKIKPEVFEEVRKNFENLRTGGDIKAVSEALSKFGLDASKVGKDVNELLVVLDSAIQGRGITKEMEERSKIDQKYVLQLQKYNEDFKKLVIDIDNTRQILELQSSSTGRIGLAGQAEQLKLLSAGGATESSVFLRQANMARRELEFSKSEEDRALRSSARSGLVSFGSDNLKEGPLKTAFLDALKDPRASIDVVDELRKLEALGDDSFKNIAESRKAIQDLLGSFLKNAQEMAIRQNEQTEIQELQLKTQEKLLRRRDLGRIFGGGLGQELDPTAIFEGARAGAGVNAANKTLRSRAFMFPEERMAAGIGSTQGRITEAQGLIQLGQILPEMVDSFRTPENLERVADANQFDILQKNRQVLAASLKGFFEGEFQAGGAFGPGGDVGGRDLQRRLFEALTLDRTKGGTDYSEAQRVLETSNLGIRNPDAARRLRGIVGSAGQVAGLSREAAMVRANDQFVTPLALQKEELTTAKNIAENTKNTIAAIEDLILVFAERQKVIDAGVAKTAAETKLKEEQQALIGKQTSANELRDRMAFVTPSDSARGLLRGTSSEAFNQAAQAVSGRNLQDFIKKDPTLRLQDSTSLLTREISRGGSVSEIAERFKGNEASQNFLQFLSPNKEGQDEKLKQLIFSFAPERSQALFEKLNTEVFEFGERVKSAAEAFNQAEERLNEETRNLNLFMGVKDVIKEVYGSAPKPGAPTMESTFTGRTTLSNQSLFNVQNSLADVPARAAIDAQFNNDTSGRFTTGQKNRQNQEKDLAEKTAAINFKAAAEEGGLAFGASINKGLTEALEGASDKTKIAVENKINAALEVIVKDGRVTPEEIAQIKETVEKTVKMVLELKNQNNKDNGLNTMPTAAPSGARR